MKGVALSNSRQDEAVPNRRLRKKAVAFDEEQNLKQSAQILTGGNRSHQISHFVRNFGGKLSSPNLSKNKLVAFTLAEVLITLAIIGVVAALTIPTLVTSYQKKMYVTQLKKSYNNLSNGFKTIMAQDGVTKLEDTLLWSKIPTFGSTVGYVNWSDLNDERYKPFFDEFEKSFKVAVAYGENETPEKYKTEYKLLNGGEDGMSYDGIFLVDGSWLCFLFLRNPSLTECGDGASSKGCTSLSEFQEKRNTKTKLWENIGEIIIDVNGVKEPNTFGRDAFAFVLGNDGMLYPFGGADFAMGFRYSDCDDFENCNYYWRKAGEGEGSCNLNSEGWGCAGRIMEENWQMTY